MIQKKALAIYWVVQKLYQFLAGRRFEIWCDHKPLQALFGEHKGLPKMASPRLQRWSLFLLGFDYVFKYLTGVENVQADALSRLPLVINNKTEEDFNYFNFIEKLTPIDCNKIRSETRTDKVLGLVFNYIQYGFRNTTDEVIKPIAFRKDELSIENGVIMWGFRVIIPVKLRAQLLLELHNIHEGIVKMKTNANAYFWWSSLDKDIEYFVNNCSVCARGSHMFSRYMPIFWDR